mgnify:CR=1 FL=1
MKGRLQRPGGMGMVTGATRIEKDAMGEVHVDVARLWGAQTQRSIDNFPIGRTRFGWGRPVIRAFGLVKQCRGARECRAGRARPGQGRTDHSRGAGSDRRPLGRRISAGRVPDRLRHAIEHERQRGDRQPRDPVGRRRRWIEEADPPERRRESQPVVQRRVSGRDARRHASKKSTARYCRQRPTCVPRSTPRRANSPMS